jgi:hypothetical protein
MPRFLVGPGIRIRTFFGRFAAERPFERPWMAKHVDRELRVDATRTRQRLGWAPRERLSILYRLPFLIENYKYDRREWSRRNRYAMKEVRMRPNLKIYSLLQKNKEAISEDFTRVLRDKYSRYQEMPDREHRWNHRLIMRNLFNAIRIRMKADFMSYCRDLAERRREQGFTARELVGALEALDEICVRMLMDDPESEDVKPYLTACISMTIRFGIDQILDTYERLEEKVRD